MAEEAVTWFLQCVERYMQTGQELTFHQGERQIGFLPRDDPKEMIIYVIVIESTLRRHGICRKFIEICQNNTNLDKLVVCGVANPYLDKLLQKLGFICHGGDYIWRSDHDPLGYCRHKCHRVENGQLVDIDPKMKS
jgi:hypothetical protein